MEDSEAKPAENQQTEQGMYICIIRLTILLSYPPLHFFVLSLTFIFSTRLFIVSV